MRKFDYKNTISKLYTPDLVKLVAGLHEHKGKQELFLEANIDELKTLLEIAKVQSTGASNRIEGIYTTDGRLEDLVKLKAEPRNRSEEEIAGYREVLTTIHENYDYIRPRPSVILQLHRDLYSYSSGMKGGEYKNSDNIIAETDEKGAEDRTRETDPGTHFCMDAHDKCTCGDGHYGRFSDSVCYLLYNHCTQEIYPDCWVYFASDYHGDTERSG